jgi:hypothetical protein
MFKNDPEPKQYACLATFVVNSVKSPEYMGSLKELICGNSKSKEIKAAYFTNHIGFH